MKNSNLIVQINPDKISRGFVDKNTVNNLEKKGILLEPIFDSTIHLDIKSRGKQEKQAKWNIQKTKENENSWDAAHELMNQAQGSDIAYVEPDSLNKIVQENIQQMRGKQKDFHGDYLSQWTHPSPADDFAWHLKKSNLLKMRHADPGPLGAKVRIGHFDTGFDGGSHPSQPKYLNIELGKNFIEGGSPYDRQVGGKLNQPGHGPATMALLAGNSITIDGLYDDFMGAVPFAEIIPFRISNSVVLLKTVEFAQALQAAMDVKCDVVTMSMGGLASKLWAEKVNEAYEAGMVVVTAAGNNKGGHFPTHRVVYPSRFNRVLTACGITYDDTPYYNAGYGLKVQMGNWGPQAVMYKAVGAYTPNVPWVTMMPAGGFSRAGGGTSAATPQVAATAALFIEKYKNTDFAKPWHRAEATRLAILESASYDENLSRYIGAGILNAEAALNYKLPATYQKAPEDSVRFPFFKLLFGSKRSNNAIGERSEMFETELLQLLDIDPEINKWELNSEYLDKIYTSNATPKEHKELADLIKQSKLASEALKKSLNTI